MFTDDDNMEGGRRASLSIIEICVLYSRVCVKMAREPLLGCIMKFCVMTTTADWPALAGVLFQIPSRKSCSKNGSVVVHMDVGWHDLSPN